MLPYNETIADTSKVSKSFQALLLPSCISKGVQKAKYLGSYKSIFFGYKIDCFKYVQYI